MSRYELFAGFRNSGTGQFSGPFISEEKLSAILKLIPAPESPKQYLFPDLFPLINFVNDQIGKGLKIHEEQHTRIMLQQQEKQQLEVLAGRYEDLFTQWNFASSVDDKSKQDQQWKEVIFQAGPVLRLLREAMPEQTPVSKWSYELLHKTEQTGRMYVETLLFYIYARAAYEPSSLARDPNLRRYCSELKEKVVAQLSGRNGELLLLSAAFHEESHYSKVWQLIGIEDKAGADALLINQIREEQACRIEDANALNSLYNPNVEDAYSRTIKTHRYPDRQWKMVCVLWHIYDRVSHLEALLDSLERHHESVDFTRTGETREKIDKYLQQIARGESPQQLTSADI